MSPRCLDQHGGEDGEAANHHKGHPPALNSRDTGVRHRCADHRNRHHTQGHTQLDVALGNSRLWEQGCHVVPLPCQKMPLGTKKLTLLQQPRMSRIREPAVFRVIESSLEPPAPRWHSCQDDHPRKLVGNHLKLLMWRLGRQFSPKALTYTEQREAVSGGGDSNSESDTKNCAHTCHGGSIKYNCCLIGLLIGDAKSSM